MHGAYGLESLCPSISICAENWLAGRHGAWSPEKVLEELALKSRRRSGRIREDDRVGRRLGKEKFESSSHLCHDL